MRFCHLHQPSDGNCGDQSDAPFAHHGRLQLTAGGEVRRHSEGQGAEEGAADADEFVELGRRLRQQLFLGLGGNSSHTGPNCGTNDCSGAAVATTVPTATA